MPTLSCQGQLQMQETCTCEQELLALVKVQFLLALVPEFTFNQHPIKC